MAITAIDPTKVRPGAGAQTHRYTMNGASQLGRLVYPSADDIVTPTNALDSNTVDGLVAMIVAGSRHSTDGLVVDGESVSVQFLGPVVVGDVGDDVLDLTKTYFAADQDSGVNGKIANAAGTVTRRVANPINTYTLFFNGVDVSAPTS